MPPLYKYRKERSVTYTPRSLGTKHHNAGEDIDAKQVGKQSFNRKVLATNAFISEKSRYYGRFLFNST